MAVAYVKDRSIAEDRVQDALVKAYRAMERKVEVDHPYSWLVRILINECCSNSKKSHREVIVPSVPEYPEKSAEDMYFHQFDDQRLHEAVCLLPEKYRLPIVLFHFEELTLHQIADILQISVPAVKTRLFRGRQRLEKIVKEVCGYDHRGNNSACETLS